MWSAPWLRWTLAAIMIATVVYHSRRLVIARRRRSPGGTDVDSAHAVMGLAMAAMLIGALPGRAGLWLAVVFMAPVMWFGAQLAKRYAVSGIRAAIQPSAHFLTCGAMVFMLAVGAAPSLLVGASGAGAASRMPGMGAAHDMAGMPGMAGMNRSGYSPGFAGGWWAGVALLLAVVVVAGWAMLGLTSNRGKRAAAGCQLAMNVTTAYMLCLML